MFAALGKKKGRRGEKKMWLLTSIFTKSERLQVGNKLPGGLAPENTSAFWKSFIYRGRGGATTGSIQTPFVALVH